MPPLLTVSAFFAHPRLVAHYEDNSQLVMRTTMIKKNFNGHTHNQMSKSKGKSTEDKSEKWVQAQRKAFTHWVNSVLKAREERVETLEEGFHNGLRLIALVEILTKEALRKRYSKQTALKVHKVNNCFLALEHLTDPNLGNVRTLLFRQPLCANSLVHFFLFSGYRDDVAYRKSF
jgi:hypothetical protein